jgi:hypothetical protein
MAPLLAPLDFLAARVRWSGLSGALLDCPGTASWEREAKSSCEEIPRSNSGSAWKLKEWFFAAAVWT